MPPDPASPPRGTRGWRAGAALLAAFALVPTLARADRTPAPATPAATSGGDLCLPAIAAAERAGTLPQHLLRSIAYVESGRVDPATGRAVPWPWAINVAGTGYFYDSKDAAIAAVQGFQARGIRSIDVGCAQINLMHHANAFASLDSAFDPQTNATYAARFLNELKRITGTWPMAAAGYHSRTGEIGIAYARKVMDIWPGAARYGTLPATTSATLANGLRTGAGIGNGIALGGIGGGITNGLNMDYSVYTPQFAAAVRRMDQDRMGTAATGRSARTETRRASRRQAPVASAPQAGGRTARQEIGEAPG